MQYRLTTANPTSEVSLVHTCHVLPYQATNLARGSGTSTILALRYALGIRPDCSATATNDVRRQRSHWRG